MTKLPVPKPGQQKTKEEECGMIHLQMLPKSQPPLVTHIWWRRRRKRKRIQSMKKKNQEEEEEERRTQSMKKKKEEQKAWRRRRRRRMFALWAPFFALTWRISILDNQFGSRSYWMPLVITTVLCFCGIWWQKALSSSSCWLQQQVLLLFLFFWFGGKPVTTSWRIGRIEEWPQWAWCLFQD